MNLVLAYPNVRRHLENWGGYQALMDALTRFEDLQVFLAGGVIRNCFLERSSKPKDFDFFLQGPSIKAALELFAQNGQVEATPYGAPRWHPISNPERQKIEIR